jgi:hypothetical protein
VEDDMAVGIERKVVKKKDEERFLKRRLRV